MSDISDISCTPSEIREAANVAIQNQENVMRSFMKNLIMIKSGLQNVISPIWMLKFVQWCKDKNIKNYTENCLLAYFQGFSSKKLL
jgi:hypothetical protein